MGLISSQELLVIQLSLQISANVLLSVIFFIIYLIYKVISMLYLVSVTTPLPDILLKRASAFKTGIIGTSTLFILEIIERV